MPPMPSAAKFGRKESIDSVEFLCDNVRVLFRDMTVDDYPAVRALVPRELPVVCFVLSFSTSTVSYHVVCFRCVNLCRPSQP